MLGSLAEVATAKNLELKISESMKVSTVLQHVIEDSPSLKERLFEAEGTLRSSVNVMVNGRDIRFLKGLETEVKNEDSIAIFPAVGGGSK